MRELSLHLLDLLENALTAGATRIVVQIDESDARNRLTITVEDNGRGMDAATVARVSDPFFTTRTTRQVGLGIPLFRAAAQRCEGALEVDSTPGVGTRIAVEMALDHIDRAPMGDLKGSLLSAILSERQSDLSYEHTTGERTFRFDTAEMRQALGDVPLTHPQARAWIEGFLAEGFAGLYGERGLWRNGADGNSEEE